MNETDRIDILFRLGKILKSLSQNEKWPGFDLGINETEYDELNQLIQKVHIYNGWFREDAVREAFGGIASWLEKDQIEKLLSRYSFNEDKPKRIGVVMAGNIPLVGFHDFLTIYLSGNITVAKLSSDDDKLFPAIIKTMKLFDETIEDKVDIVDRHLTDFDAVIATGSNNSARHFEYYFGKYPHIIRKNRNAVAVLDGTETKEELAELGKDIFTFFGLGCRNVSKLLIPQDFKIDRFYEGIYDFHDIVNHNKYANNYDYNKALYLMNEDKILDNGFLLLKEDRQIASPLGAMFYERYKDEKEVESILNERKDEIQLVVGKNYVPFGRAQQPKIDDFADGVDTLKFIEELQS